MAISRSRSVPAAFEPFLYALHSSPSLDAIQTAFMRRAGGLVPAHAWAWYQFRPGTIEPCAVRSRGVSDRFLTRYESEGRSRDPLFQRVAARFCTVCSDINLSAHEQRAFEFQENISSGQVARAIEAPLVVNGRLVGTLNVARDASARPFTRLESERLALIARHASIALARIQYEFEIESRERLLEAAFNGLRLPLVIADPEGEVVFANRAAGRMVEQHGDAVLSGLKTAAAMLRDDGRRVATIFAPYEKSDAARYSRSWNMQPGSEGFMVHSARLGAVGAILSLIDDSPAARQPASELTRREREIAELAAQGLNNPEIASAASISRNTVKQHLKHVFDKMQVRSRARLAADFSLIGKVSDDILAAEAPDNNAFPDGPAENRTSAGPALPLRPGRL